MSQLSDADLITSRTALHEMFVVANEKEGFLSGEKGPKPAGPGMAALKELDATRISLGSPENRLTRLTPKLFKSLGVEVDAITAAQMAEKNFYYMTVAVSMIPGTGVQFTELKIELEFEPAGAQEALVHSLFPTSEFKAVINWGAGLQLGLDAGLNWRIGTEGSPVELQTQLGGMEASVSNKNDYKGFIAIPEFSYRVGRADVEATGAGNSFCYWRFAKPVLKEIQTMEFGMVFKLPSDVKKVNLNGKVKAEISRPWLTASLRSVWQWLNPKNQNQVEKGVALGDLKSWSLKLPTTPKKSTP